MTDLRKAAAQALKALEAQHTDRLAYSNAKRRANATCGEFKDSPLSALIESGYMQSLGKQTHEAIYALHAALAAQPQQAAADHPAYQLGFADGAAQYAHKTRGQIREQAAQPVACPYCAAPHTLGSVFYDQTCAGCIKRISAQPQQATEARESLGWSAADESSFKEQR